MVFGLEPRHPDALPGVLRNCENLDRAVVFGSRARGDYRPTSDLDLALFGSSHTLRDEGRLASDIESLNLPVVVDLVRVAMIESEAMLESIRRDGVEIWGRQGSGE